MREDNLESLKNKNLLVEIKFLFGLHENVDRLIDLYFENQSTDDLEKLQSKLYEFVLDDRFVRQYPPNKKYLRSFLKHIISLFETNSYELNETILDEYLSLLNENNAQEKHFILYFSKNDISAEPIVIEQYTSIIVNGTTGLHAWPACFKMIEYLHKNPKLLEDKTVLELGSGVGLLGFYCLKNGSIRRFMFTDSHELVLKQIKSNCAYNQVDHETERNGSKASVHTLNWSEPDESDLFENENLPRVDFILATDIIYDPDLIEPLVNSLDLIWNKNDRSQELKFLIASTIRNETTYAKFISTLS